MAIRNLGTPPSGPTDAALKSTVDGVDRRYAAANVLSETIDRRLVGSTTLQVPSSGRLRLSAVWLPAGAVVTSVSYFAGAAGSAITQRWFALYDGSLNKLRVTADSSGTAWAVNTVLTLPLTTTYTVPTDGIYYVGICEVATTPTAMRGYISVAGVVGIPPILSGDSTASLTNAASAPAIAAAITASANHTFAYVS